MGAFMKCCRGVHCVLMDVYGRTKKRKLENRPGKRGLPEDSGGGSPADPETDASEQA